ncbi:ATPase [Marinilongibacter aquaticus]|uniref:DUF4175 family protein n=1 Tax=Marinilongibacter aquaticus TaxID=2975157 RepID=UPI0021BD2F65|nr:DUF4175 family protein [Marinilongibacter aquaticus]UBM57498.1 ATPase [Marinilongibacter aquaticus]
MHEALKEIENRIEEYKKKYYTNQLIKGLLISGGLVLSLFLFINFIEYFGRFSSPVRAILLFTFLGISLYTLVFLLAKPALYFFRLKKGISEVDAAKDIGRFFPEIGDKLLNTLQLSKNLSRVDNSLILASIQQKTERLNLYQFTDAIDLKENKKYVKYVGVPLILLICISAISPSFLKSSERIIKFNREFEEEAPFDFIVLNKELSTYRNQDFQLQVKLEGQSLPEDVYMLYNGRRFRMNPRGSEEFEYNFNKVQSNIELQFEAAGFNSKMYKIDVLNRPELLSFDIEALYPAYLHKAPEKLKNVGNLVVPQGTKIHWNFRTSYADSLYLAFNQSGIFEANTEQNNEFGFTHRAMFSEEYEVGLKNKAQENDEKIAYYINVIPDERPKINVEEIRDSVLYQYIALGGNISDDYGFDRFELKFKKNDSPLESESITINKNQLSQNFYYQIDLEALKLSKEDKLEYYLEIWDNDGVQGPKVSRSKTMVFQLPNQIKFDEEIQKQADRAGEEMEKILQQTKEMKLATKKLTENLKTKKQLEYSDKKNVEELLEKREKLLDELQNLKQQFEDLQDKQARFQNQNEEIEKKVDQLQEILNELMKDESSEIFKQLKDLLEENQNERVLDKLDQLKKKDRNLDRDLERSLKLFKQLQLEQKVDQVTKELEDLADKQEQLAAQTESENKGEDELGESQEKMNEQFDQLQEKFKDIQSLSKELRKETQIDKAEINKTEEQQEKASEEIKKQNNSEAGKAQKKASQSMRKIASDLAAQMKSAEMQQMELDLEALRAILENLVQLSFDQESVMRQFRGIGVSDPKFISLSQQQLKLVDDAKVVEDSLYSLAENVMQIQAFVTKEVTKMKNSMDSSIENIRARDLSKATSDQQFSMTSINNLALMLSDTFKQMQEMLSKPGSGKGDKQNGVPMPGIGKKQGELNKRMKGLGKEGMKPSELSKELAQIANEQAKLRRELEKLQNGLNGTKLGDELNEEMNKVKKEMDKTEDDLINKRIKPELIERQNKVETRLLKIEKAVKEQEMDSKRKSNTGKVIKKSAPPELENYFKEKQKQLELIQTTPPNFTPFYKKETDNYFKTLK